MQILIISSVASFASLNEMVPQENSTERGGEGVGAVKRGFPILTKTQPQMFTIQTSLAAASLLFFIYCINFYIHVISALSLCARLTRYKESVFVL